MKLVSFYSDFGENDYYSNQIKTSILKSIPDINFIDCFISNNNINDFESLAYNLCVSMTNSNFDIFFFISKSFIKNYGIVIAIQENKYFILPNNGIISIIRNIFIDIDYYLISENDSSKSFINSYIDLSLKALNILETKKWESIDANKEKILSTIPFSEGLSKGSGFVQGRVLYIDNMDFIITNISKDYFIRIVKDCQFRIFFNHLEKNYIDSIYDKLPKYDTKIDFGAYFNELNYLTIFSYNYDILNIANIHKSNRVTNMITIQYYD